MPIILQDKKRPGEMLLALATLLDHQVTALRIAVAYTTQAGCDQLLPLLEAKLGKKRWQSLPKTIVTGLDFGITEPKALEYLSKTPNCSVYLAGTDCLNRAGLRPSISFHPKIYILDKSDRRAALIGSANFTGTALTINTEVAYLIEEADAAAIDQSWAAVIEQAELLTPAILDQYREKRGELARQKATPLVNPDIRPLALAIPKPGVLAVFGDSVSAGQLQPSSFDRFWIEAGTMSSGGSHNQLELPRGANHFFGYHFNNYSNAHEVIGYPLIIVSGRAWRDRKLTWHGNNMMERINLPTKTQGGFEYRNSSILFARTDDGFELLVVPWDDPLAVSWREASTQIERVYKLGERSNRICGLF
jgi:HKD family nuclease